MNTKEETAARLKEARIRAGFADATSAARHFNWKSPTYLSHENASRGIRPDASARYAEAFGVSLSWLLTGKDTAEGKRGEDQLAAPRNRGFEESGVGSFAGHSATELRALLALADHCDPKPRHVATFQATRHIPGLSILRGDILLIDLRPDPQAGQTVIVQIMAPSGESETHLATHQDGALHAPHGEAPLPPRDQMTLMGACVAVVRLGDRRP